MCAESTGADFAAAATGNVVTSGSRETAFMFFSLSL
jgi:hypothetical protein